MGYIEITFARQTRKARRIMDRREEQRKRHREIERENEEASLRREILAKPSDIRRLLHGIYF